MTQSDLHAEELKGNRPVGALRGALPGLGLFVTAPLVAEFLLGNMSITKLGMLAILAPLYGGGALLIRESVRRGGLGWATVLLLGFAYGVLEEAVITESLFNPDYLGLHLGLLEPAHVAAWGIGAWWTVFVLTLHTVWSISVPIALVESLVPDRATDPWLGRVGLAVVSVLFVLAAFAIGSFSIRLDAHHFVASRSQFGWASVGMVAAVMVAYRLPAHVSRAKHGEPGDGWVPGAWVTGLAAFVAASMFLLVPSAWGWAAVAIYAVLDLGFAVVARRWSTRRGWNGLHRLSVAGGAAMAYAWHALVQTPSLGSPGVVTRVGNLVFAAIAAGVIWLGARRSRRYLA